MSKLAESVYCPRRLKKDRPIKVTLACEEDKERFLRNLVNLKHK